MRTCYLHLGMPKTGSTSIQDAFDGYKDAGVQYAKMPFRNHETALSVQFSQKPHLLPAFIRREASKTEVAVRRQLLARRLKAAAKADRSVVFSAEGIVDSLSHEEIAEMIGFFAARFERVVPIIYIRPLASLLPSQFQQRVKFGLREFRFPSPDYRRRFEQFVLDDRIDDIIFARFDRDSLVGGDVVTDFAQRIGATSVPQGTTTANESLTAEGVGALYGFNKYVGWDLGPRQRTRLAKELFKSLRSRGERKFGFSEALVDRHLEKHAADIDWIENVAGFKVGDRMPTVADPITSEAHLLQVAEKVRKAKSSISGGS